MAGMIKSSIHHFDGFVGLAGNGGGSGKDGRGTAKCTASLVSAGIVNANSKVPKCAEVKFPSCKG